MPWLLLPPTQPLSSHLSALKPQGLPTPNVFLWRGEQQPPAAPRPFLGIAPPPALGCALCQQHGGLAQRPPPQGRPQPGILPEFFHCGPSCNRDRALHCPASSQLVRRNHVLPDPAPPSDLDSCTLAWEESLSHWLPPSPPSLDTRAWPGGWHWQQVLLLSRQPHPSSRPEFPGSRTTERHLWAVPHWPRLGLRSPAPGPHPSPGPRPHPVTLDWARPCLPRTTGATWVAWAAQ